MMCVSVAVKCQVSESPSWNFTPYNEASKYLVLEIGLKNLSFPCTLYLGHHVVLQSHAIMFPCNLYLDVFTTAIRK